MQTVPSGGEAPPTQTMPAGSAPRTTVPGEASPPQSAVPTEEANVPDMWGVGDVVLGLYEVMHVYEGGGMGLVYRVHHRGWNTDLAVKSPRPDFFRTSADKDNFIREAETWIKLGLHPHTASCYYVRSLGGIPRVFAEYVEGGSLQDWIAEGRLYAGGAEQSLVRILDVAIQFAWGLHYAHEQGLVHQDVKPANVLMTTDGIAKVTDFGLARARAAAREASPGHGTQSVMVSSGGMTPAYCSPEQANKFPLTRKTDIWSWAVSILEMFTGEVTWGAGNIADSVLTEYLAAGAPAVERPQMPDSVAQLLARCLNQNPGERPADFAEVAAVLREAYRSVAGKDYERAEPKPADALADSLNNQAASLVDIGQPEEAMGLWKEALRSHPGHPEATYNSGLMAWRAGRITDEELLNAIATAGQSSKSSQICSYLAGVIHFERRDAEAVLQSLSETGEDQDAGRARESFDAMLKSRGGSRSSVPSELSLEDRIVVKTPQGAQRRMQSLAVSPDGIRTAAGVGRDILVWTLGEAEPASGANTHRANVCAVTFLADGSWMISSDTEGRLIQWDVASMSVVREWSTKIRDASGMSLDPTGSTAVVFDKNGSCELVDLAEGASVPLKWVKRTGVLAALVLPEGKELILGCKGGILQKWDLTQETNEPSLIFEGHDRDIVALAGSKDGQRIFSGGADQMIRIWDAATGERLGVLRGHSGAITGLQLSGNADRLLTTGMDDTVRLWDVAAGRCLRTFGTSQESAGSTGAQGSTQFTSTAMTRPRLPALRSDGHGGCWLDAAKEEINIWQEATVEPVIAPWVLCRPTSASQLLAEEGSFASILRQADAARKSHDHQKAYELVRQALAVPGHEHSEEGLKLLATLARAGCSYSAFLAATEDDRLESETVSSDVVAIDAEGRRAITGGGDGILRVWDLALGKIEREIPAQAGKVSALAISGDGKRCAFGTASGTLAVIDIDSSKTLHSLPGHFRSLSSVAFSKNGRSMASSDVGGAVIVWDVLGGKLVRQIKECREGPNPLTFVGAGDHLAVGSNDGRLLVFRILDGVPVLKLRTGRSAIVYAESSPRSGYVLTGDAYGAIVLWCLKTGKAEAQWQARGGVRTLGFTPDARFAVTLTGDGMISVHGLAAGTATADKSFKMSKPVTLASISRDARSAVALGQQGKLMKTSIDWQLDFTDKRSATASALPNDMPWRGVDGLTSFRSGIVHRIKAWRLHWVALLLLHVIPLYFLGGLFGIQRTESKLIDALRSPAGKGQAVALTAKLGEDAITPLLEFINDSDNSPEERITAIESLGSLGSLAKTKVVEHVLVRTGRFDNFGEVRDAAAEAEKRIFMGE